MMRVLTWVVVGLAFCACGTGAGPGPDPEGSEGPVGQSGPISEIEAKSPWAPMDGLQAVLPPRPWTLRTLQDRLETYELVIPQAAMDLFERDIWAPEQPATFIYEGTSYPVNVRLRGASARTFPKKSWNVDFEDLRFQGREELNLVAEYQDSTLMVEKWAYDILEAMEIAAPATKYVRVIVNGTYQGVYLDIEEVDKKFIAARPLPDRNASIYRAGGWDGELKMFRQPWQGGWLKQTNKLEPWDDLDAFLEMVNYTPEPELPAALERHFELDSYLRLLAAETLFSHNYIEDARDYFVHDRVTGRWYKVPWDLNNADARFWPTYGLGMTPVYNHPLFPFTLNNPWLQRMYDRRSQQVSGYEPTFGNLRTRVVNNPVLRARLLTLVEKARKELLDPKVAHARIDQMYALISPHMVDDPWVDKAQFANGPKFVRDFISLRYDFLEEQLDLWRAKRPGLVIEAFDPAAGWIELKNRSGAEVSTSGLVLTTYLRRAVVPSNVPARTLAPGETVRFTAGQLGVSFERRGEVGLFDGQTVYGVLDLLFYGELPAGRHYVRGADADGTWTAK
jgi:spore coat protein H